jgi:CRISPR-associated protein Cas5d
MKPNRQVIRVWGEFACFSRPEMKVERFSYPVPTPSAARGILDAIYCKPTKFRWQVLRIEVLKPIRYIALRRNEVKEKAPTERTILQWATGRRTSTHPRGRGRGVQRAHTAPDHGA